MLSISHLTDDDLERYLMGQMLDESDLTRAEEHLIACAHCLERAEAMTDYIAAMKEALSRAEQEGADNPQH